MGVDFNISEYCKSLKTDHNPPFICPIQKCNKAYKSIIGLQYHLSNYDHDNPPVASPLISIKKKGRGATSRVGVTPKTQIVTNSPPKEAFTYSEAQKIVQFDIMDKSVRVSISEDIPIITVDNYMKMVERGECPLVPDLPPEPHIKLPEASYKEIKNYNICDAPTRPNAYIRFIEKSAEELDGEVRKIFF